ncbi:hypothetical protein Leryth_002982, partial [Lithospermum erythrorhizon]
MEHLDIVVLKCVTKTSRTLENPGRVFWSCPLERLLKSEYDCAIEENESLKGELAKEKLTTRCLKKLLKGILLFMILVAVFMAIGGSIDENKM